LILSEQKGGEKMGIKEEAPKSGKKLKEEMSTEATKKAAEKKGRPIKISKRQAKKQEVKLHTSAALQPRNPARSPCRIVVAHPAFSTASPRIEAGSSTPCESLTLRIREKSMKLPGAAISVTDTAHLTKPSPFM
jgi:hypothetical protein